MSVDTWLILLFSYIYRSQSSDKMTSDICSICDEHSPLIISNSYISQLAMDPQLLHHQLLFFTRVLATTHAACARAPMSCIRARRPSSGVDILSMASASTSESTSADIFLSRDGEQVQEAERILQALNVWAVGSLIQQAQ